VKSSLALTVYLYIYACIIIRYRTTQSQVVQMSTEALTLCSNISLFI